MKRWYILFSFLLVTIFFTGCSKKMFTLSDLNMDFTEAVIKKESTGSFVPIEEEKAHEVYDKLKDISFVELSDSKDMKEALYTLTFKNMDKVVQEFQIIDNNTIAYKRHFYTAKDNLDLKYIEQLFEVTFQATVLAADTSLLVQPVEGSSELRSSDKIVVSYKDNTLYGTEGKSIPLEQLEPGDTIEIIYNGLIMESYPAQITADSVKVIKHNYHLSGLLAVIDAIYQEDAGLNSNINQIVLDLTDLTNLSEKEKEFLLTAVGYYYEVETRTGTYEELVEEGVLEESTYFEDGIIIKLNKTEFDEEKKILTCGISKWRSPLGAVGSNSVTAVYNGKGWKVTKENMWIS
ncbi:hypothetical protein acsn021_16520 [Anaerocolumna cellulosilytica]|uniref:Uncharacterized protein n=1 Tax=Anaerocolumna cellulosilytica TaxID=433286 RepID=A0A6S6QRV9_9FIRM|nr:DUF3221 domain-containing protein [Anaerocolumna cellulosilytica]MBB5197275.1 antitoxin component YwqK of YwqJK toxin-antitoxin module [Anaerocolumna cellulosilytica]BCJ94083.1 hypothetical protein acsn021_16520 [Anaerocolumna cellulosilytica]